MTLWMILDKIRFKDFQQDDGKTTLVEIIGRDEAEAEIIQLIEEIIGEDELAIFQPDNLQQTINAQNVEIRNNLRSEQRQALAKLKE